MGEKNEVFPPFYSWKGTWSQTSRLQLNCVVRNLMKDDAERSLWGDALCKKQIDEGQPTWQSSCVWAAPRYCLTSLPEVTSHRFMVESFPQERMNLLIQVIVRVIYWEVSKREQITNLNVKSFRTKKKIASRIPEVNFFSGIPVNGVQENILRLSQNTYIHIPCSLWCLMNICYYPFTKNNSQYQHIMSSDMIQIMR